MSFPVASLREVREFILEHDRNQDHVLDSREIDPKFISRYDRKEGSFPKQLESGELLRVACLHAPTLVDALAITEEDRNNRRWQGLLSRADGHHGVKNVLAVLLSKGYSFSEGLAHLEDLEKLFPDTVQFWEVLRVVDNLVYKGADVEWILNHFLEQPQNVRDNFFYSTNLYWLWDELMEVGNAREGMAFVDRLIAFDYRLVSRASSNFDDSLRAFKDTHLCEGCDSLPLISDERRKSLIFNVPLLMAYDVGETFIDHVVPVLIAKGVTDKEIATLFEIWRHHQDASIREIPSVMIQMEQAGIDLPVQLYTLHRIGRMASSQEAKEVLSNLSFAGDFFKRLRKEGMDDLQIANFIEKCVAANRREPGQVISLAKDLVREGWKTERVNDFISACPFMIGVLDYHLTGSSALKLEKMGASYSAIRDLYLKLGEAIPSDFFSWEVEQLPDIVATLKAEEDLSADEALARIDDRIASECLPGERPLRALGREMGID